MTTLDSEKLACPICTDILKNAVESSCGHAFCEHCLNQCLEVKPNICPVCHKDPSPIHPSYLLRSLCDSFKVEPGEAAESGTATAEKNLGNEAYNKKKYADSILHYNNAFEKTPKDTLERAVIHNNRAQCYIQLQQYHRALLDLEDCIRLNPAGEIKVKATIRKAMCQAKLGDYKTARQTYQAAIQLDKTRKFRETIIHALKSLPPDIASTPPAQGRPAPQQQQQQQRHPTNPANPAPGAPQYYDDVNLRGYPGFVAYQYGAPAHTPYSPDPAPVPVRPAAVAPSRAPARVPAPPRGRANTTEPCRTASTREERRRRRHHGECSIQ